MLLQQGHQLGRAPLLEQTGRVGADRHGHDPRRD